MSSAWSAASQREYRLSIQRAAAVSALSCKAEQAELRRGSRAARAASARQQRAAAAGRHRTSGLPAAEADAGKQLVPRSGMVPHVADRRDAARPPARIWAWQQHSAAGAAAADAAKRGTPTLHRSRSLCAGLTTRYCWAVRVAAAALSKLKLSSGASMLHYWPHKGTSAALQKRSERTDEGEAMPSQQRPPRPSDVEDGTSSRALRSRLAPHSRRRSLAAEG